VPPFIDSHAHLADSAFAGDVDAVIARARAVGARALVCIGESPAAARRARAIVSRFPGIVHHTCGVHPHDAASWDAVADGEAIRGEVAAGAVAVGECGLDYFYDNAPREQQRRVLEAQLRIAGECRLPMVLHTRDAEEDTRAFLRSAAAAGVGGVLHCFTGSPALAMVGLEAGWYVSFSGIITFRKWTDDGLLRMIPADRLLVESDAPYLAPTPHRGRRNEPSFVVHTLEHLARIRDTTVDALGTQTLANTCELFGLPLPAGAPDPLQSPDLTT
jgi:TatD DNase family protein